MRHACTVALAFLCAALCLPCLAAEAPTKIPLKLFAMPDPKDSNPMAQADVEVFRAFQRKYPQIQPQSFSGIKIAGAGMDSGPLLAIAGGNSPDVMYVNFRQSDTYIQQGFLYPLDEFIERDVTAAMLKDRVADPVWPVIKRDGPAIGGLPAGEHVWAVPYGVLVRALFYRKDAFAEAGLDPNRPPKDWNELFEFAKRLSDPGRGRYGIAVGAGQHASWDWMAYLWSAGGEAIVKRDGEWVAAFDTDEAVTALEFYLKLTMERWTDTDGKRQIGYALRAGDNNAWTEGRLGMMCPYLDDKSIGQGIDPSVVGIAPFPRGPTGLRGTELNCMMMGVFSDIQGRRNADGVFVPAELIRDAAWKYVWFYDSEEARKIRVDKLVELGYGKMLNPLWLRKYGYEDYVKFVPEGWEEVFTEAMKCGKPEPYGRNCQNVYDFMTEPLEVAGQRVREDENFLSSPNLRAELKKILVASVEKTNRVMIGKITPQERRNRDLVAGAVSLVLLALFSAVLVKVWKMFAPPRESVQGWGFRRYAVAYLIMLPAVCSILTWYYLPMLVGTKMAFMDFRFVGESSFVGIQNVADVLYSPDWWRSLWNTFRYMALILGLGFAPPIILAILLQEVSHGKVIYRIVYYLPAVMSSLVVIYLWKLFFEPGRAGIMNQIVLSLAALVGQGSMEPVAWLDDPRVAMLCCVIPSVWAGMGPGCLIYLAALKGIPPDLYEAADLDGASFGQKIRHIVIPSIKALIIIQFIGAFIGAAMSEGMILVMTYGKANTEVAGLHIFKEAYISLRFGTAISMAWILGVTLLVFTVYQLKMLSNVEFKTTGK
jgi:multiple sugar transport system permease protein